jgi:hypothetical protein
MVGVDAVARSRWLLLGRLPPDATTACDSTAAATANSTTPCTRSPSPAPAPAPGKTRAYLDRKLAQGKTRPEAYRCLKRHLARRIWRLLHDLSDQPPPRPQNAVTIHCNIPTHALALMP